MSTLAALAGRIQLLWGWQRAILAFAAGALAALSMPPTGDLLWPILAICFPVLVWLIDGTNVDGQRRLRAAAWIGWCFGFGYFLAGLWWIGVAFLVDAPKFGWLMPLAVIGLPAFLALFMALGTVLARLLWHPGPMRVVAFAVGLTAAEWLRGHVLTGFPWNSFGYALAADIRLAQTAAYGGLWLLTLLALLIGAAPAVLGDPPSQTPRPWRWVAAAGGALVAMFVLGALRVPTAPVATVEGVRLRIMQPNLPQDQKFRFDAKDAVMARYLRISDLANGPDRAGVRDVTHLIWPESAFPFFLERQPDALAKIAELLPPGVVLITGAARLEPRSGRPLREGAVYNSIQVLDDEGAIVGTYDKVHLVPFGEFLPFQAALEAIGLEQLTRVQGGFTPGRRHRALPIPGAPPTAPLICYEAVFPSAVVPSGGRPAWLLNLTNDGWFGHTSGPYQHLAQARLRAIEEGLPLVRAANTGISAIVDPYGRMVTRTELATEGVIDGPLPRALEATPYGRFGDFLSIPFWICLLLTVVFSAKRQQPYIQLLRKTENDRGPIHPSGAAGG